MTKASTGTATIDPREAEHFGRLAKDWWDPRGSSAMLHRLNPPRLRYIRAAIDSHWLGEADDFTPLTGRSALDMGCGAGLLAEPLARLGASVTGVDAAPQNIGAATAHAKAAGLDIEYLSGGVEAIAGRSFDLVASMEVIEHVADPQGFVDGLAGALADDGLMILSTPNRTQKSRLAMITLGEGSGAIPRGTHDWDKFITPEELTQMLEAAEMRVTDTRGLTFSPGRGFTLSNDLSLDYFVTAVKA
ncbi:MAG: bifunctional 3-demethylubiquinol 3-O-methyltransferase/2-polyprenyl-6-hydroxyphenol methylase [Sphingomonas sp.]|nr:bifunctional 3-demethylubiquinol 3-O-methyltransferase/2-polyprenyl-6-hydroxyphenol methylase [Sphingomonas sp.]